MSDVSCRGWGDIVTALASIISVITTVMSSSQTLKSLHILSLVIIRQCYGPL